MFTKNCPQYQQIAEQILKSGLPRVITATLLTITSIPNKYKPTHIEEASARANTLKKQLLAETRPPW